MSKKLVLILVLSFLIIGSFLIVYRRRNYYSEKQYYTMDTILEIKVWGKGATEISEEIIKKVSYLSGIFDDYNPNSEVSLINKNAGISEVTVSEDTIRILQLSKEYHAITKGSLNVMMGSVSKIWGFKDGNYRVPDEDEISKTKELINIDDLYISGERVYLSKKGEAIDFGGLAKGYALDEIYSILAKSNVESALINFGGSVLTYSKETEKKWKIGIKHPRDQGIIGIINVKGNNFISTSGDYERNFEKSGKRFCHIMDPKTCSPVDNGVIAVTVIGKKGSETDAFSTAFMILSPDESISLANNNEVSIIGFKEDLSLFGNAEGISIFEER